MEAVATALEPNKAFATFSKDQVQSITFDYLTEAFPFWILGHARPRLRATSFRRIVWNWWALKSLEITSLSMASDWRPRIPQMLIISSNNQSNVGVPYFGSNLHIQNHSFLHFGRTPSNGRPIPAPGFSAFTSGTLAPQQRLLTRCNPQGTNHRRRWHRCRPSAAKERPAEYPLPWRRTQKGQKGTRPTRTQTAKLLRIEALRR